MSRFSLEEQYQIAQIVSRLRYLSHLDSIWTQQLASATEIQPESGEIPTLQSVAGDMQELLEQVPAEAKWIHDLLHKDPQRFDDDTLNEALIFDNLLLVEQKQRLMAMAQEQGGFRAVLDGVSAYLYKNSSAASALIATKMKRVNAGQFSRDDLPDLDRLGPVGCALGLSLTLLSLAAGQIEIFYGGIIAFFYAGCLEIMGNVIASWGE